MFSNNNKPSVAHTRKPAIITVMFRWRVRDEKKGNNKIYNDKYDIDSICTYALTCSLCCSENDWAWKESLIVWNISAIISTTFKIYVGKKVAATGTDV